MKRLLTCSPLAVALALAGCDGTATAPLLRPSFDAGGGQGLNLQPGGFGEGSFAAWKPHQGQPDNKGSADAALYFQKMTATATVAAAFAVITGVEGQDVSTLTLSWDHRTDGWCGAGAPRWNLSITGASGASYLVFLGCDAATHSSPFMVGTNFWITDSPDIAARTAEQLGSNASDALTGHVSSLAIIFDEGTDVGPGFVFLDNITVNTKTWTSPGDNGT